MTHQKKTNNQLSRRDFVTKAALGAGAAGVGLGAAGCAAPPQQWDREAEVVVVGYGGAGAIAALTAHDEGANVLVIEKQPATAHTSNTRMSLAVFLSPTNVEDAVAYMEIPCRKHPDIPESQDLDDDIIQVWAEYMVQNRDYLRELGGYDFRVFYDSGIDARWPGNDAMKAFVPVAPDGTEPGGFGLNQMLDEQMESRNIPILWSTPATRLVQNDAGEVVGVMARSEDGEVAIKAAKAVILTTGGFEYDDAAIKSYLAFYPVVSYGNPDNTGDGMRMAQGAGADLWHMGSLTGGLKIKFDDFPTAFNGGSPTSGLIVDKTARRFAAENMLGGYDGVWNTVIYDPTVKHDWLRIPLYLIFDETRRLASRLAPTRFGAAGPIGMYEWSEDNSAEIERGWVLKGDTLAELAAQLDLDAATLEAEVAKYNGFVAAGEDADFARRPDTLVAIDNPPYYALRLWPGLNNTMGGPRRNANAQIMHVMGEPIPRLYSAGELGSVYVFYPQGGANLGECIAFGRIAGEQAARLEAWG